MVKMINTKTIAKSLYKLDFVLLLYSVACNSIGSWVCVKKIPYRGKLKSKQLNNLMFLFSIC